MTPKTFAIYLLLKVKNGLANLWKLKNIKLEKKIFLIKKSSKSKYYYFLRKLVLLKQIYLEVIIYDELLFQNKNGCNGTILQRTLTNNQSQEGENGISAVWNIEKIKFTWKRPNYCTTWTFRSYLTAEAASLRYSKLWY